MKIIIYYTGPPKPHNVRANLQLEPKTSTVHAALQWNVTAYNNVTGNFKYFVTILSPKLESSSFTTANKYLLLSLRLLYGQEYNVSITSSNCVGNSTPTNISIIGEYNNFDVHYTLTSNLLGQYNQCRSMSYLFMGKYEL